VREGTQSIELESVASAEAAGLRYVNADGPGISRRNAGKGFTYIGADSKPVRGKATLERIKSLAIPPAWKNVWICPLANGHIQAAGRDARGRKQYRYHARYREVRDETKFDRMLAFGTALPKIRRRVAKDLSLPELPQRKVIAAIVRLLDETCIRVGNEEYAKANKSYGLTTLKDRHVRFHGDSLQLQFRGKSNQDHDVTLTDRRLAKIVKQCQDIPGQELFQYKLESGEYARVDSTDVNDYLREITQQDFSAKDFRTWHGSGLMAQQLAELGPAQSETEAKRNIAAAVKATANKLGNRPAACRKYYVHPAVFEGYLDQTIFETMGHGVGDFGKHGSGLRREELALMRLVKPHASARGSKAAKAS
jgi:DNA topoisomerase-1